MAALVCPPSVVQRKKSAKFKLGTIEEDKPVEKQPCVSSLPPFLLETDFIEANSVVPKIVVAPVNAYRPLSTPPFPRSTSVSLPRLPRLFIPQPQPPLPPSPPLVPFEDPYHPLSNYLIHSLPINVPTGPFRASMPALSTFPTLSSPSSPTFLRSDAPSPSPSPSHSPMAVSAEAGEAEELDCHKLLDLLESFIPSATASELAVLSSPSFLALASLSPSLSYTSTSSSTSPSSYSAPSTPPSATVSVDPLKADFLVTKDGRAELSFASKWGVET
jgi:hypothetical protein